MPADHASAAAQAAIDAVPRDPSRPEPHWRDITDRIPLNRKHRTKASPPAGGWPTGGTQVQGYHLCTPCGDNIWPGEHIYDNGDGTVRCAVCEIKHRAATTDADNSAAPTAPIRTADEIRACGHTTQQHRADDGHAADTRSQDQAVRQLTAELEEAVSILASIGDAISPTGERPEEALGTLAADVAAIVAQRDEALGRLDLDAWDRITAERDQARATVTAVEREHAEALEQLTQAWAALNAAGTSGPGSVADHIRQLAGARDRHVHIAEHRATVIELLQQELERAAHTIAAQAEQLRANGTLLTRLRGLDEQADRIAERRDRAWAEHDTAPAQTATERPDSADEGTDKGDGAMEAHRGAEGDDGSLADRLAGALADALSWFRHRTGPNHYTARVPEQSLTAWRRTYAEWADLVAPEGRETDDAPPPGSAEDRAHELVGYEVTVRAWHRDGLGACHTGDVIAQVYSTRPTLTAAAAELLHAVTPTEG